MPNIKLFAAEDGKLPVQSGGLHINDETTEEDKAEAKEALVDLGFLPVDGITKGTTDIGAGSAMTSLMHLVYEE